jgi:predicted NACHT family NTPase
VASSKHFELRPKAVAEVILKQELYFSTSFSMSQQVYDWKRFWCPRSSQINLGDRGYLTDPESEYGKYANPELVGLEVIADVLCLVLLGEPGIGKSQELINLKDFTENNLDDGHKVLEVNLRSCTSLKEDLFKDEQFIAWKDGTHRLYLFLDSLDEGLLQIQTLATQLVDTFKKSQYRDKLSCLYLRIACRTAVFPNFLEEGLKELWQESNVGIYELAPLRRIDVQASVAAHGLDANTFLEEVDHKGVVPFAIKPITLKFLLNTFQKNNGQFPPDQTLVDLYLGGCRSLCEEQNQSRRGSRQIGHLEVAQRLIVAARIAAVTVFANRFAVWTEPNSGNVPGEDVLLEELCLGDEIANERRFSATRDVIEEVLDTGLFSSRGTSRMGWAHQTYAEFLAAWYLAKHEISLSQIQTLIFSSEDPEHRLVPQLHETASWLASLRADVLQDIIKTDPDILLQSDIPADANIRSSIVDNLLIQYEQEKIFDRHSYGRYTRLKHPDLVAQLQPYIYNSDKQIRSRNLAIDIASACKVFELQEELVNLVLDSSQPIYLRESAASALCSIGNADTIVQLKPLAVNQIPEDEDDRIKGYILDILWPSQLTVEELFKVLTPPKNRNFIGSYQIFLEYKITPKLQPRDLVYSLDWVKNQGIRCFEHPFEQFGDTILLKAWDNFDFPGVVKSFTEVALVQWREHQSIISHDRNLKQQFRLSLLIDRQKRLWLCEQAILIVSETGENSFFLISTLAEEIFISEDFLWILDRFLASDCDKSQHIWLKLLQLIFDDQNLENIDAIIVATQKNEVLHDFFSPYFAPVELESIRANEMRANYLENQERKNCKKNLNLLDPSPRERVLQRLERLENGDLPAWSLLNSEMTLSPDSRSYGNELEWSLTNLPGWQDADGITKTRIINGAKQYILKQDDIVYDWIGSNSFNRLAMAGCRALQLILKTEPYFLDTLSFDIWKKWTPAIVASPCEKYNEDEYLEMVKLVYLNAPDEAIDTLLTLIDKTNQENDYISAIDKFRKCWNDRLKLALLKKSKDNSLKPRFMGQLLQELLKYHCDEAREFAESLITIPLPLLEDDYERSIIAAKILVENSDSFTWASIWSVIHKNISFGRLVFERVANTHPMSILLNLDEIQLADLYIWLACQYPHSEDPDHSNEITAHFMSVRESLSELRDGVLQQLIDKGTLQSCIEIQRLIRELPHLSWLARRLSDAKENMRRHTWTPPQPEDILRLTLTQAPSTSDLLTPINEINQRTKQMAEQPNFTISGGTFNGPVNLASNQGSQPTTIIGTQNNYFNTDEALRQEIADLNQFISELDTKHPNIQTETEAEQILDDEILAVQTDNPTRWQSLRHQMSLLKRQLLNPERHLQAAKATLIEVTKTAYEKSLIVKAIITYIDKLSEEPNHGA